MDFASQRDPIETELSVLMPSAAIKSQNVSLPLKFESKAIQLITDFDDIDDEHELKFNEGVMAKDCDQD